MATYLNDAPVFGPVHSRRLGISLGVNLMPATGKICSFDCIYCENGFNRDRRTADGYLPADEVADALERRLAAMRDEGLPPDVITFAGNGEPTASPAFPAAVDAACDLRDRYAPQAKVAVLSNGVNAARPEVRAALMRVDDNILKLDTVDPEFVALVDRPVAGYDVARQVETFASYDGHVMVQTIFLRGEHQGRALDNTDEAHVAPWLDALATIRPQAATIYTIARETPAPGLRKAPADVLDDIGRRVRALGIPCSVSY